jgi:DNA adenine methylase
VPDNSFIYCDPPYQTIATKGKYKDDFNHEIFWQWCRDMATKGHIVYVSEYNAPNDFECVWQKEINQRMNNNVETSKALEKLFKFSPTNVQ